MKRILQEHKYRINMAEFSIRKTYLSQLITELNNQSLSGDLTPSERNKIYNTITNTTKVLNEICKDCTLESLE
ncbi:MAG TPA: hypothetical protein VKL21_06805, partial [Candidatus Methanoperedens sp.]|nr:hypothetical protein [Candidatus Methanoperedens sp.]